LVYRQERTNTENAIPYNKHQTPLPVVTRPLRVARKASFGFHSTQRDLRIDPAQHSCAWRLIRQTPIKTTSLTAACYITLT